MSLIIVCSACLWYKIDKIEKDSYRNYSEIMANAWELTHIRNTTDTSLEGIIDIRSLIQTY